MSDQYESRRGQIVGEYRLMRELGAGNFGTVYLAEHIHEHTQVAIKILQVPLSKSEDFRDFINEARTIRLRHRHIIPLLDFGVSRENFPYLVLEYAPNGTLRDRHPKGAQVPLAAIVEYVDQIASALQYAHDCRIIHRDVKPANMLMRADGTLMLSDFGIAKIMEQNTQRSMQTQIGTPIYMAPEQHMGYPCFASDQYALAVVAYEWITGMHPFRGTTLGLAFQHITVLPPSILTLFPTLPPRIEQVIFKGLSKAPEQRFATVQEFASALRAAVQLPTPTDVDLKKTPFVEPPSKGAMVQQSIIVPPTHTNPQTITPPIARPSLANQVTEPDGTPARQVPPQMSGPTSSNRPYTRPSPIITTNVQSGGNKTSRHFFSARRNILLLCAGLLVGLLVLALVINTMFLNPPTPNKPVLNANTVSHLVKLWAFPTGGIVTSSPTVVDNVVYVGSWNHNVYAIDAQSGRKKWTFQTGGTVTPSLTVTDGLVFASSADHNLYALDAQSGQKKWVFQTGDALYSSPVVQDGVVYLSSWDHNLYAVDMQSGQEIWAFPTGDHLGAAPTVLNGIVYVGSYDKNVYAINELSGEMKWSFPTGDIVGSSPAVMDGVVYAGSADKNVYAIDAQSGQKKWSFPTQGSVSYSSPTVAAGVVYIGSNDHNVYAIDAQSGRQRWAFQTGGAVYSLPRVANGVVYVGSYDNNVYAIDARSGQKKWTFQTRDHADSTPAVVNNVVYVGSDDGNVYAFGLPSTTS